MYLLLQWNCNHPYQILAIIFINAASERRQWRRQHRKRQRNIASPIFRTSDYRKHRSASAWSRHGAIAVNEYPKWALLYGDAKLAAAGRMWVLARRDAAHCLPHHRIRPSISSWKMRAKRKRSAQSRENIRRFYRIDSNFGRRGNRLNLLRYFMAAKKKRREI